MGIVFTSASYLLPMVGGRALLPGPAAALVVAGIVSFAAIAMGHGGGLPSGVLLISVPFHLAVFLQVVDAVGDPGAAAPLLLIAGLAGAISGALGLVGLPNDTVWPAAASSVALVIALVGAVALALPAPIGLGGFSGRGDTVPTPTQVLVVGTAVLLAAVCGAAALRRSLGGAQVILGACSGFALIALNTGSRMPWLSVVCAATLAALAAAATSGWFTNSLAPAGDPRSGDE